MAWVFELAVECGSERYVAAALKGHFENLSFDLKEGSDGPYSILPQAITTDEEQNWWQSAICTLNGSNVVRHSEDSSVLQKLASVFYDRLRSAQAYRFALVGVEANQFSTFTGLKTLVTHTGLNGLVLRKDVYDLFNKPTGFECFARDYVWRPYR